MLYKKALITLTLLTSPFLANGDEGHPEEPPQTIDDKFFETIVNPIVQTTCSGCHGLQNPAGGHSFVTKEDIIDHSDLIFDAVKSGRMPLGNPDWKNSDDATILLYWLSKLETSDHDDGHEH